MFKSLGALILSFLIVGAHAETSTESCQDLVAGTSRGLKKLLNTDPLGSINRKISGQGVSESIQAARLSKIDIDAIQKEGQALLKAIGVMAINSLAAFVSSNQEVNLVLFSGEKCSWCDYVKPTYAMLSPYLRDRAGVFYSEDRDFRNAQGLKMMPILGVYGPYGRILMLGYADTTTELLLRIDSALRYAPMVKGDHYLRPDTEASGEYQILPLDEELRAELIK